MEKLQGSVTISRGSDNKVRIRIKESKSRTEFVTLSLDLDSFAEAITGVASVKGELEVKGLETVGKTLEVQERKAIVPFRCYDQRVLEKWLQQNAQEEGWIVNSYLGSQNSIINKDNTTILIYTVRRYI